MTMSGQASTSAGSAAWNARRAPPLSVPVPVSVLSDVADLLALSLRRVRATSDGSAYSRRMAEEIERVLADVRQCQAVAMPPPERERVAAAVATIQAIEARSREAG
ncbi:MAG: hypothetical protein MUF07_17495 [Steroidobacteraceae bacterium]|jgi:hypothetical protein|nr:hypothetical protein [Steroidobacteraceae bacterium]